MKRTGFGNLRKRVSSSSSSSPALFPRFGVLATCRPLALALGDEARGLAEHAGPVAEDRQCLVAARQEIAHALLGAVDAELSDEGGLAQRCVGAGRLAERRRIALDVEQIIGDLEGFAQRLAVIVERLVLGLRGLSEQ